MKQCAMGPRGSTSMLVGSLLIVGNCEALVRAQSKGFEGSVRAPNVVVLPGLGVLRSGTTPSAFGEGIKIIASQSVPLPPRVRGSFDLQAKSPDAGLSISALPLEAPDVKIEAPAAESALLMPKPQDPEKSPWEGLVTLAEGDPVGAAESSLWRKIRRLGGFFDRSRPSHDSDAGPVADSNGGNQGREVRAGAILENLAGRRFLLWPMDQSEVFEVRFDARRSPDGVLDQVVAKIKLQRRSFPLENVPFDPILLNPKRHLERSASGEILLKLRFTYFGENPYYYAQELMLALTLTPAILSGQGRGEARYELNEQRPSDEEPYRRSGGEAIYSPDPRPVGSL